MNYLLARLKEPGTLRSLAVVLFALRLWLPNSVAEQLVDVNAAQSFIEGLIGVLGLWSALMPEKKVDAQAVAAAVAAPVANQVTDRLLAEAGKPAAAGLAVAPGLAGLPDAYRPGYPGRAGQ